MRFQSKVILAVSALLSSFFLLFVNYQMWSNPIDLSGALLPQDAEADISSLQTASSEAILTASAHEGEALDRPLFHPGRRPSAAEKILERAEQLDPEQLPEQQSDLARPGLKLLGTRVFNGTRSALVQPNTGGESVWLAVGDNIGGWRLGEITDTTLTLLNGQQSSMFELYND